MDNIFAKVRGEIDDFIYNPIEVVPGYIFNQYDTIRRCHLYLNSRFWEGNTQYHNREKIFFNISKFRRDIAAKFLNIDTKDIRLWEMNPKSKWSTFFLEKELKLWMKQNKVGKLLNECALELPSFGSLVVKKTKKGAIICDLRRLFLDPTVESIKDSRFVTLKHFLTTTELRNKVKDGWDSNVIEQIISDKDRRERDLSNAPLSYEKNSMTNVIRSTPYFEIYERFGEVPKHFITGKKNDDELVRALFIVYEPYSIYNDDAGNYKGENGKVLFKSPWKGEYPFKDCHYSKTMGRWLGIGVVEDLFEAQERTNELANQKRISMEVSSIHLFQTKGKNVINNILTDLKSGDLIEAGPDGEITPIVNEERNLAAFGSEEQQYDMLADRISFATSQAGGEALATSTPATNAVIQQNNTVSLFGFKRENFGLFLSEFFNDFVLPQVLREISNEHIFKFAGTVEEIQALDIAYIDVLMRDKVINDVLKTGKVPTIEMVAFQRQELANKLKKEGGTRYVNIRDGFYDDVDFEFDILVTNEQENVAVMAQNTFQVLTAIAQNPTLLQDPIAKALLFEYAQKIGINPLKLEVADAQQQTQQSQIQSQGGQIPSPISVEAPVGQGQPTAKLQ